ncbi:MAG: hypothetical protein AVDCRST_MAG05-3055, partial [uncultured Rubrobacteraceae bacterium]
EHRGHRLGQHRGHRGAAVRGGRPPGRHQQLARARDFGGSGRGDRARRQGRDRRGGGRVRGGGDGGHPLRTVHEPAGGEAGGQGLYNRLQLLPGARWGGGARGPGLQRARRRAPLRCPRRQGLQHHLLREAERQRPSRSPGRGAGGHLRLRGRRGGEGGRLGFDRGDRLRPGGRGHARREPEAGTGLPRLQRRDEPGPGPRDAGRDGV